MREKFKTINFRQPTLDLIDKINDIIDDYQAQGLRLSLRQTYYQLVSQNIVPNTERSYKNVGTVVSNGRLAGLIDWDAIEDRVRQPREQAEWSSIQSIVNAAVQSFRLPRMQGQEVYVELHCEKDALAGVLEPLCEEFHVTLMVNRGYSSQSAMYEVAQRIERNEREYGCQESLVLYLGDLDPSGEDMVRDIRDRLELFGCYAEVQKVALTIEQVRELNLPPNPAKLSDSRAAGFIAKYGRESWELDAIPPTTLQRIVRDELTGVIDQDTMDEVIRDETVAKDRLLEVTKDI